MHVLERRLNGATVTFSHDELVMLNNALNEVCNGVLIEDFEFQTRLGFDRSTLQSLLDEINIWLTVPK